MYGADGLINFLFRSRDFQDSPATGAACCLLLAVRTIDAAINRNVLAAQ
jgi:hypothetical protein